MNGSEWSGPRNACAITSSTLRPVYSRGLREAAGYKEEEQEFLARLGVAACNSRGVEREFLAALDLAEVREHRLTWTRHTL